MTDQRETTTSGGLMRKSEAKRAASVGEYKEAFSRLMNDEVEGVPNLQAKAGATLRAAEGFERAAIKKASE